MATTRTQRLEDELEAARQARIAELQARANALAERQAGRDPSNIIDGYFVNPAPTFPNQVIHDEIERTGKVTQEQFNTIRLQELENEKKWRPKNDK